MLSFQCIRNTSVKIFPLWCHRKKCCEVQDNTESTIRRHNTRSAATSLHPRLRHTLAHSAPGPPTSLAALRSTPSCACRIGSEHHLRRVAVRHSCNMPCPTYFSGFGYLLDTGFAVELDEPTHTVLLHTAKSCPKHSECLFEEHGPSFVPVVVVVVKFFFI
ncbi:uncharacterized protein LOC134224757 [Armigeres subalbatus]|uniref:uncharacterized protein LOC134224757 n=1 Tax=Armigeres subalbatus TaxID=124917 RepID=UPI002ED59F29